MNHWENMEPIIGTFEATSDFSDWLKELKKSSIVEIDIIGLHDKTTGEKREFVAIDKVLEIVDKLDEENMGLPDWSHEYEAACKDFRAAVIALLKGDENEQAASKESL